MRLCGLALGVVVLAGIAAGVALGEEGAASRPTVAGPTTQAIAAGIRAYKVVSTQTIDGRADAGYMSEEYWDREQGFLRREVYPHGVYITRSGADSIKYREGSYVAERSLPVTAERSEVEKARLAYHFDHLFMDEKFIDSRAPEKDVTVGGKLLKCYAMKSEGGGEWLEWADERGMRVRQEHESRARAGASVVRWHSEWTFNPELRADFWKTPASVQVVEPRDLVSKAFPLAGAVFQKEVNGTIAAVHSVRQDENGVFYFVVSTRVTDETMKALESATVMQNGRRWRGGSGRLISWDEKSQKPTRAFMTHEIATITCDGIWVAYVVVGAREATEVGDHCAISFGLAPVGTAEELTGKSPPKQVFIPLDLRAGSKVSAEAFAGEAYEALRAVAPMGSVYLHTASLPNVWRPKKTVFVPAEVGKEEFEAAVGGDVEKLGGIP